MRVARIVITSAALFAATFPATAQVGRPLQIEDYYRIKSLSGATISPDGRWVVYTVSQRIEDDPAQKRENQSTSQTFVVSTEQPAPRHVQHDGREVANTRWTDDNLLQYAVGGQQFKVAPGGGTPVAVEGAPGGRGGGRGGRGGGGGRGGAGGASTIASPDGSMVVELREKTGAKPEPKYASDFEKRHQERFKGVMFDWKDFQRDGAPFPAPDPTAGNPLQITVRPSSGGEPKVLVDEDIRPSNVVWHPDGKMLAFTANAKWRDELRYAKTDLYIVTLNGSLVQTTNDGYNYSDIEFSPDGKYLSYARTFGTDMVIQQKLNHGGPRDLFLRTTDNKEINLTADWDLEPGDSRWSPDGKFIYFTAAIGGESHLFRVNTPDSSAPGGRVSESVGRVSESVGRVFRPGVQQVTKGPRRINGITYDKAMTKIAYTVGLHESPGDVYVANIDGSGEKKLTDVHADFVKDVALSKSDRLEWASKDGTKIEGWLTYPHGYARAKGPYPLIVFSHGGPHAATGYSFDFKKQYFAANGYFVLDTNFRSSTGYGEKFKWATWGAWGDRDGEDVMSGIDYVISKYPIDGKRVGHTGHSYGGFMTNWLITQYPDRFAAAISGAGISNWISDYGTADIYRTKETEFFGTPWDEAARNRMIRQSPLTYAGRVKTPTLFVHGEVDQRVPYEEAEQMYFALKRRGVPAKMIQYAGMPHGISGHNNVVHRMLNELAWWEKYLKPSRPATSAAAR